MKSYTDLEQSRNLVGVLPVESADMYYSSVPVREWKDKEDKSKGTHIVFKDQIFALENLRSAEIGEGDIYAWSLMALLDVLPYPSLHKTSTGWRCDIYNEEGDVCHLGENTDNPIDTCYKMILALNELNLL